MVRLSVWTIALMVLLRLAIGWHFLFEGYQKIRSHDIGTTETNRPWTAEGYYRVAEGPARDLLVKQFGDPDQETLDRLRLLTDNAGERSPARTPAALALEWNDYLIRFSNFYKLTNDEKDAAGKRVETVKGEFVEWLVSGKKTVKRTPPTGGAPTEVTISVPDRILEYEFKVRELRDIFDKRLIALGRDVEKKVPQMRAELATYRKEFQDDIAEYTTKIKNGLASSLQNRFSGFYVKRPAKGDGKKEAKDEEREFDNRVLRMLKPRQTEVKFGEEEVAMPPQLGEQWDAYLAFVKDYHPKFNEAEATRRLNEAKRRYVRFLLDRDEFSDKPAATAEVARRLKEYEDIEAKAAQLQAERKDAKAPGKANELASLRAEQKKLRDYIRSLLDQDELSGYPAPATEINRVLKEYDEITSKINLLQAVTAAATSIAEPVESTLAAIRESFIEDIQRHTEAMKGMVGEGLPADVAKGYAPEERTTSWLQRADRITMWVIAVSGACLLLGLFTRLACLAAAGFLIMTYLAHPAFPWLPASPMNEGNYVFVNKNVIEALALLMLATTRSGRWLGLDAWLGGIGRLFRRKRSPIRTAPADAGAAGGKIARM